MMLYNCSILGESFGISFVSVMVISTAFPLRVSRLNLVTGSGSRFGRNNIIPSKAWTWPITSLWLLRRATRSRFDSSSGLKLTLYWYTPKLGLVINLKWLDTNGMLLPVTPCLSTTCAGFVAGSLGIWRRGGLCSADPVVPTGGLCSCLTLMAAMASVGGATGFCCGWGATAAAWAGGGPLDRPRPTGATCSGTECCVPSPGLRAASPPAPPRPRPRLLPLARPVIVDLTLFKLKRREIKST